MSVASGARLDRPGVDLPPRARSTDTRGVSRRLLIIALTAGASLLCGCASSSAPSVRAEQTTTPSTASTSQINPGATSAAPAQPPAADVRPKLALASRFLFGNRSPRLAAGKPGRLSVVAQATHLDSSGSLPIVIRNNTPDVIVRPKAAASIRGSDGKLIASGEDQGFHPNVVRPGEITIGYVYFENGKLPPGSTVEFQLDGTPQDQDEYENIRDVVISEVNFTGRSFVGKLRNPYQERVTGPTDVEVTCFNSSGVPIAQYSDFAAPENLPVGGTSSFSISLYDAPSCPIYILGASGFSND